MKYQFIAQHQRDYAIALMSRVLEVSISGYYAWRQRLPCRRKWEDDQLAERIASIFQANRRVYGSPRILAELQEEGITCSRKRIARLMREQGISAQRKRRRVRTTDSNNTNPVAPNLLKRDFTAERPNRRWVADITAIETAEGYLYLAAVVDVYSRMAVGWAMESVRDESLVTRALQMAFARRRPQAGRLASLGSWKPVHQSRLSCSLKASRD